MALPPSHFTPLSNYLFVISLPYHSIRMEALQDRCGISSTENSIQGATSNRQIWLMIE